MSVARVYPGRMGTVRIGKDIANSGTILNVVAAYWERNHDITPRTTAHLKYPIGWRQRHSWIEWRLALMSMHTAFTVEDVIAATAGVQPAIDDDADNYMMDYFVWEYFDSAAADFRTTFTGAIVKSVEKMILDYDDSVWVYKGLAKYAVEAAI